MLDFILIAIVALAIIHWLRDRSANGWQIAGLMIIGTMGIALAQDPAIIPDPSVPPAWLADVIRWAHGVPTVGPIVVEVGKWLGLVAGVMTALSVAVSAILKIPQLALVWAGQHEAAQKLDEWNKKAQPYLQWLSVFNVQKK